MSSSVDAKNLEDLCGLLGLPETEVPKLQIRLEIVNGIRAALKKQNLTHQNAATKCGVGRTVITAVINGNLNKISTDRLIDIAQGLGLSLILKVV
ncbi:MAG: XRE family transcriptional regulator [Rhizobacter sp.]|nr:XRE family transcriptional regulator [Bacteriovorax sp.]